METKSIKICYKEYKSIGELGSEERRVLEAAIEATHGSYAPYSHFNVGAAVLLDNGEIVKAANQENDAFPSGMCAERSALFYAHSRYPDIAVKAIAIVASQNGELTPTPTYPCGACRQVLYQSQIRAGKAVKVIVGSSTSILVVDSIDGILPFAFDNFQK